MRRRLLSLLVCVAAALAPIAVLAPPASAATMLVTSHDLPMSTYSRNVVDLDRGRAYLSPGPGDDRMVVTDLQGAPVDTLSGMTGAGALALSGDGTSLFVALETGRIVELDTRTLQRVASYPLPGGDAVLDLGWEGGRIWVLRGRSSYDTRLSLLETGTGTVTATGVTGYGTRLAVGTGRVILLGADGRSVLAVGPDGAVVDRRAFTENLDEVSNSATGQVVLTRRYSDSPLVVLDPATLRNVRTTRIDSTYATTDGVLAAAAAGSWQWHDVAVVDAATSELLNTFRIPSDVHTGEPVVSDVVLSPEGLLVVARGPDGVSTWFEPEPGVTGSAVTLTFPDRTWIGKEYTLSGSLSDAGEPIAGAQVTITDRIRFTNDEPVRSRTVTTAADGSYSFPYTARGWTEEFHVQYVGDAQHPPADQTFGHYFDHQPTAIEVSQPAAVQPGEPVTFEGTVKALGEPLANGLVEVSQSCTWTDAPVQLRTDDQGAFRMTVVPGRCEDPRFEFSFDSTWIYGSTWVARTVDVGWVRAVVELAQPSQSVMVGSTFTWTGRVTRADAAVVDAPVSWTLTRESTGGTTVAVGEARTDDTGGFSIQRTLDEADGYLMNVRYAGDSTTLGNGRQTRLEVTRIATRLDLDPVDLTPLTDDPVAISGTVTTIDGEPMAGRDVEIRYGDQLLAPLHTDADGRFRYETVPDPPVDWRDSGERSYSIIVLLTPTYAPATRNLVLTVGPEPTRLTLDHIDPTRVGDHVTISGRLTTSEGEPLGGRSIRITHQDGDDHIFTATTDEAGRFSVDRVIRTGYTQYLSAEFPGTRLLGQSGDSQNWLSTALPGVLTLRPVGPRLLGETIPLRGRLTTEAGVPAKSWVRVTGTDESGEGIYWSESVPTDADGSFSFVVPADRLGRTTFTARSGLWEVSPQTTSIDVDVRRLGLSTTPVKPLTRVGDWAVYDAGRDPVMMTRTSPARAGLCIAHQVQRRIDGRWRPASTTTCLDSDEAGTVRQRLTLRHPAGTRLRVRAVRESETATLGDWVKLRFR